MPFQIDHPLVVSQFDKNNYRVVVEENEPEGICAIYFSSHSIYYPNSEECFRDKVIDCDSYEWYGTRFRGIRKHIFVRDIHKQWYLNGINSRLNSHDAVLAFLKKEVGGRRLLAIGSSAGGYAAILFGTQLGAEKILAFNAQIELNSLLEWSSYDDNPLVFDCKDTEKKRLYDLKWLLRPGCNVFYFYSSKSWWDVSQANHVRECPIHTMSFRTSHHGIPFLKCSLPIVMDMSKSQLLKFSGREIGPLLFSIEISGVVAVVSFCFKLAFKFLTKKLAKFTSNIIV